MYLRKPSPISRQHWALRSVLRISPQRALLVLTAGVSPQAGKQELEYPPWALGLLISLMVLAALPIPIMLARQLLLERLAPAASPVHPTGEGDTEEEEKESPADPDYQSNGYLPVRTEDRQDF